MRDCMDRRVTPPKGATSPTWGPPPPCKQALREPKDKIILYIALVKLAQPESALQYLSFDQKQFHLWNTDQLNVNNLYSTEKQSTKYFFPLITPGGCIHRLIREGRITFYMCDNEQQHLHGNSLTTVSYILKEYTKRFHLEMVMHEPHTACNNKYLVKVSFISFQ